MSEPARVQASLFGGPAGQTSELVPDGSYATVKVTDEAPVCPQTLRNDILEHLERIGVLSMSTGGEREWALSKEAIRAAHAYQRACYMEREARMLGHKWPRLMTHFAEGYEVDPAAIDPKLEMVDSEMESGDLFRFATTLWSAPVSRGFGRRMRYLVRDRSNDKLIGIFALGDPVFNLKSRDEWIGWDVEYRRKYLASVMDAYVVGAVPPYAQLLGGKLVAALIGCREVSQAFRKKYAETTGIISGEEKRARLALVTVTSALGRSSLYNRLHLRTEPFDTSSRTLVKLERIGKTSGYGHFHLPDELFERLRRLIGQESHAYYSNYEFGDGPNWRMRVARVGLQALRLDPDLLKHGIRREVYAMPLTDNFREVLTGHARRFTVKRPSAKEVAAAALERWMLPRAETCPEYRTITKEGYLATQKAILARH